MNKNKKYQVLKCWQLCLITLFLVTGQTVLSQKESSISSKRNRYKIIKERADLWYFDEEVQLKYQHFIELDTTYYVGYMYKGLYSFERAADFDGYKKAIEPLEKALGLFEGEFTYTLRKRYYNVFEYMSLYEDIIPCQMDFEMICTQLSRCYTYMEEPSKALEILQKLRSYKMQWYYFSQPENQIAWLYYRNRMHTGNNRDSKYAFLKNDVYENLDMSFAYIDSSMMHYQRHYYTMKTVFQEYFIKQKKYGVHFDQSLFYSYHPGKFDTADYFFKKVINYYKRSQGSPYFYEGSFQAIYNNYGIFKLATGEFEEADRYFLKSKEYVDPEDKSVQEMNVWLSMIDIYQGNPGEGVSVLEEDINKYGSRAGFGWHNLALSRAYYYGGNNNASLVSLIKAKNFQEMHIGTSWTKIYYDFVSNLLTYQNTQRKIEEIKFENKNAWYSFSDLVDILIYYIKKVGIMLGLSDFLSNNPEREIIVYKLFSTESNIIWDEVWPLVKNQSTNFFSKKFYDLLKEEKRENIKKYFRYFLAQLHYKKKNYPECLNLCKSVLTDDYLDKKNEKLLMGRTNELMARVYKKEKNESKYQTHLLSFYKSFPQLVPYSGLTMSFNLEIKNEDGYPHIATLKEQIDRFDVNWIKKNFSKDNLDVRITIKKQDKLYFALLEVIEKDENILIRQLIPLRNPERDAKRLVYTVFDVKV
ncbi:MAG: hypothetical protein ACOCUL_03080 [Bacteroidota bacterium]